MDALETHGRRALAWVILVVAAILVLKIVVGVVIGLLQAVLVIAALVAVGFGVLWALRHL